MARQEVNHVVQEEELSNKHMKITITPIIACVFLFFLTNKVSAQVDERPFKTIPTRDTLIARVGKTESVNGWVLGNAIDKNNRILLAMGDPFPNQIITLVIKVADKNKFPVTLYQNTDIIATGVLELYDGKLQMLINDPKQISTVTRVIHNDKE